MKIIFSLYWIFILRLFVIFICICVSLISCVGNKPGSYLGYSKSGLIESFNSSKIRLRHLEVVNAFRYEQGVQALSFSNALNASASTHAIDISNQKRAWNFGSDSSSPQERAEISGFNGILTGENVSETFEGEFEVLKVWLKNNLSSDIILDPYATHIGLGWFQEENGTIWWVQDIGKEVN